MNDTVRMAKKQDDIARIRDLDDLLRSGEGDTFNQRAMLILGDDRLSYAGWYSHLLSSLAVVSSGEALIFGQAEVRDAGTAQIVVVTKSFVLTADVDTAADSVENPFVSVVSRASIESFETRVGQGVDVQGSRGVAWPETIAIGVKYRGIDKPLELRGAAYVMHDTARPAPIWTLLNELRSDLARLA